MPRFFTSIFLLLAIACTAQDKDSSNTNVILVTDPVPSYPGGYSEMRKFIRKNLGRPESSLDVYGTVYVEFLVNEDGSLSDFKILKGLHPDFDAEAIVVLRKMPRWIPAKENDKPLTISMVLPVKFE